MREIDRIILTAFFTDGSFKPIPFESLDGLEGIPGGFRRLQEQSIRGKKLVARVSG